MMLYLDEMRRLHGLPTYGDGSSPTLVVHEGGSGEPNA